MVTPPAVEQPELQTQRQAPERLWPTLAIVAIVSLLCTNAIAWYVAFDDDNPPPVTTNLELVVETDQPTVPSISTAGHEIIDAGPNGVYGRHDYRGNLELTGETNGGFRELLGVYWDPVAPGGLFGADPIAYGRLLYVVSSTNDVVYAISQTDGSLRFSLQTNGRMQTSPAIGQITYATGPEDSPSETATRLVAITEDGTVYIRNALDGGSSENSQVDLPEDVTASPIIADGKVIVATEGGSIFAIGLDSEIVWRYPVPNSYSAPFSHAPAVHDGIIYAPDARGRLHMVDLETGLASCPPVALGQAATSHPVVTGSDIILPTDGSLMVVPTGDCRPLPELIVDQVNTVHSPAYAADAVYSVEGTLLVARDARADRRAQLWDSPFDAGSLITTSPTYADGMLYFGTYEGLVHAIDATTGESVWSFDIGQPIFGGPVVTTNGIFVTTTQEIFSIAGR